MAKPSVGGISGVLGGLIAPPPASPAEAQFKSAPPEGAMPQSRSARRAASRSARRGRPPGRTTGSAESKTKVTLRVDAALMDDYRDWSWTARCQLGELVERALEHYRSARR